MHCEGGRGCQAAPLVVPRRELGRPLPQGALGSAAARPGEECSLSLGRRSGLRPSELLCLPGQSQRVVSSPRQSQGHTLPGRGEAGARDLDLLARLPHSGKTPECNFLCSVGSSPHSSDFPEAPNAPALKALCKIGRHCRIILHAFSLKSPSFLIKTLSFPS